MARFNIESLAYKWFFFMSCSYICYIEFFNLFLKQLSFNSDQIGVTSLFGVQNILLPILLVLSDRLQARKLLLWIVSILSVFNCVLPLLPLVVSLPTCFSSYLRNETMPHIEMYRNASLESTYLNGTTTFDLKNSKTQSISDEDERRIVPWSSNLFILLVISRVMTSVFVGVTKPLANLATVTYLGAERARFGAYFMWMFIGTCAAVAGTAVIAWMVRLTICGVKRYGYFSAYFVSGGFAFCSILSLAFFKFEYEENRVIDWLDVKEVVFDCHYLYIYFLALYAGICSSFQISWEFWYLDGMEATPLILGIAALIRRSFLAACIYASSYAVNKVGELMVVCFSFLLFSISFFVLSFTREIWYVLALDVFQAGGYGLSYSALMVYFSKAGSNTSSGVILGLLEMCYFVGNDFGAMIFGVLFHTLGTHFTLIIFAVVTALNGLLLFLYLKFSKSIKDYEKIRTSVDTVEESDDDISSEKFLN